MWGRLCGNVGKPHSRIHKDAALDNIHRLRAIDGGICGQCPNVRLEVTKGHRQLVEVRCWGKYSPLMMYRQTELGKIPECPGFGKKSPISRS